MKYILWFSEISLGDIARVGGKNASLGHMVQSLASQGVRVPDGFALTVDAFWYHLEKNGLKELISTGSPEEIREKIAAAHLPEDLAAEVTAAYQTLSKKYKTENCDVAVRSSATAEDLPGASFAGQQETFLHIQGEAAVLEACRKAMASLFTDRAVAYRKEKGFENTAVGLSVGIQKMVRADRGVSGVAFTLDPETGFPDVVTINAAYGLGETVVQGTVNPDEFVVFKTTLKEGYPAIIKKVCGEKALERVYASGSESTVEKPVDVARQKKFTLNDKEIIELSRIAMVIEEYYSAHHGTRTPMDIEWARDGDDNKLYIVQARPETVHAQKKDQGITRYSFEKEPEAAQLLVHGQAIGTKIATGIARVARGNTPPATFNQGDILIADMTTPDWVSLMKKASAIVTNRGGRTCHAAIVSREFGIPAVIGTRTATTVITEGTEITVDCARGSEGAVFQGKHLWREEHSTLEQFDRSKLLSKILVTMADPDRAFVFSQLPVDGVGLVRLEFVISNFIGIHPMALAVFDTIKDENIKKKILERTASYQTPRDFYIETVAQGIGMIAAAFYPRPVIVRLADFKTNEYGALVGGVLFETAEENPMLGFRGASRYLDARYAPAFALECAAIKMARMQFGLSNIKIMVPFVRTVAEAESVGNALAKNGLERGKDGLEHVMMVEIPSNVILIDQFARFFDGFSIGSNDLAQLTLGLDRDSALQIPGADERNAAVMTLLLQAVDGAHAVQKYIGICGQAPSDFPEIADALIDHKIDSLSLNPDAVIPFLQKFAK